MAAASSPTVFWLVNLFVLLVQVPLPDKGGIFLPRTKCLTPGEGDALGVALISVAVSRAFQLLSWVCRHAMRGYMLSGHSSYSDLIPFNGQLNCLLMLPVRRDDVVAETATPVVEAAAPGKRVCVHPRVSALLDGSFCCPQTPSSHPSPCRRAVLNGVMEGNCPFPT